MTDVLVRVTQAEANLLNRCVRAGQSARSAGHLVCGITTYSEPDQEIQRELNDLNRITREAHFHAMNPDEPIPDGSRVRIVLTEATQPPQDDPQPDERETDPDLGRGLYGKFRVERVTPSTRGIDHTGCRYFVLDPQHDVAARTALACYAQVARAEGFGPLADDLDAWVRAASAEPIPGSGQ